MHHFFSTQINNGIVILPSEEAHHAMRVLRLQNGDEILVFDGKGATYKCRIDKISKKEAILSVITETKADFRKPELTLLVAPTKNNDRFEWFLEKATEIGVGKIVPVLTEHSERKVIKKDRLEKVLVSAMKQSVNPYKPELAQLTPFEQVLERYKSGDRFIAHCYKNKQDNLFESMQGGKPTAVLIGPEGDFSPKEIEMAITAGWKPVTLGHQRYRTETAAVLAVHSYSLKQIP